MIFNLTLSEEASLGELTNIRIGADGTVYPSAGDAVRGQVTELTEDFNEVIETIISTITKGAEELTLYPTEGYINSSDGSFTALNGYVCYYLTAPLSGQIWVNPTTGFGEVAIYDGTLFATADFVQIGKSSDNTLPYENNKMSVTAGNVIVLCMPKSNDALTLHYPSKIVLNDTQLEYIAESLNIDDISNILIIKQDTFTIEHKIYSDNGYGVNNNDYDATELIPVVKDDVIKVSSSVGSGYHSLLAYNSGGNVVATAFDGGGTDLLYTVPTGIAFVRCQGRNENYPTPIPFSVLLTSNAINRLQSEISKLDNANIVFARVDADNFKIIVPNEDGNQIVEHDFEHITKTWDSLSYLDGDGQTQTKNNVKSCDYWNCYYDKNAKTNANIAQGNSNFITLINGKNYHAGDGHGNEVITSFYIIADGVVINYNSLANGEQIKCQSLHIIERSNIYSVGGGAPANDYTTNYPELDTSGEPVINFVHTMDINYSIGNKVIYRNSLLVKRNNIRFAQCHGAMLECPYSSMNRVMCNNAENTINDISSGVFTPETGCNINLKTDTAQKCNIVQMWGGGYLVKQEMIQENPSKYSKSNCVFLDYTDRLKCYFQPVTADFGKQTGEMLDTFNEGDVISVKNIRTFEIS